MTSPSKKGIDHEPRDDITGYGQEVEMGKATRNCGVRLLPRQGSSLAWGVGGRRLVSPVKFDRGRVMLRIAPVAKVRRVVSTRLPTQWGTFQLLGFEREILNGSGTVETAL